MLAMNPPFPNSSVSSPRRFLLLPEEPVNGHGQRPRIRRYRLTSVCQRPSLNGVEIAGAPIARELDCAGRI